MRTCEGLEEQRVGRVETLAPEVSGVEGGQRGVEEEEQQDCLDIFHLWTGSRFILYSATNIPSSSPAHPSTHPTTQGPITIFSSCLVTPPPFDNFITMSKK